MYSVCMAPVEFILDRQSDAADTTRTDGWLEQLGLCLQLKAQRFLPCHR